jgi:hypothetical protein
MLEDGKKNIAAKMDIAKAQVNSEKPWAIDEAFGRVFAPVIGFIHYHAGFDFWRKQAKITSFFLMVLIPCSICIFHAIKVNVDAKNEAAAAEAEKNKKK